MTQMQIAIGLAVLLGIFSAFHGLWALGLAFPAKTEAQLARMVTGFRDRDQMPPSGASAVVAATLLVAALAALELGGYDLFGFSRSMTLIAGLGLGAVFLLRGIVGYTPAWRRLTPEPPFSRLDPLLYSPLCLVIGIGFVTLISGF